jgi:hypothetical protein
MTDRRGQPRPIELVIRLPRPTRPRLPAHVAVLVGLSTGAYAVLLAGAATQQASSDAAVAAARQPMLDSLADLAARHDALAVDLAAARERYGEAAVAYQDLQALLDAYIGRLDELTTRVGSVQAEAGALPGSLPTPRPPRPATTVTVRQVAPVSQAAPKPPTVATTGASGK